MENKLTKEVQITLKEDLETIHIKNDIFVYKHTSYEKQNKSKFKETKSTQGFCLKEHIEKFNSKRGFNPIFDYKHIVNYEGKNVLYPALFSREQIERMCPGLQDFYKTSIKKPFDAIKENSKLKENVLLFSGYDHSVYYLNEDPYPSAIYFDYMSGKIHDGCYDLEKAFDILKGNKSIEFFKEVIQDIPYYNSDSEHSRFLEFIWIPSKQQAKKLNEVKINSKERYFDKYKAIFDLDLLNLKKARYFDEFYETKKVCNCEED